MDNIQRNIDDIDNTAKEKTENILKIVQDKYRNKVVAAIANVKDNGTKTMKAGRDAKGDRYKLTIEVYTDLCLFLHNCDSEGFSRFFHFLNSITAP
jgi:hypothetical protein